MYKIMDRGGDHDHRPQTTEFMGHGGLVRRALEMLWWRIHRGDSRRRIEMALFNSLIAEIDSKFGLGAKSSAFIAEVIRFMTSEPGGIAGFLDRLKRVSLAW